MFSTCSSVVKSGSWRLLLRLIHYDYFIESKYLIACFTHELSLFPQKRDANFVQEGKPFIVYLAAWVYETAALFAPGTFH